MSWWKIWSKKSRSAPEKRALDFGMDLRIAFGDGRRIWTEEENLVDCLEEVLLERGFKCEKHENHLVLESGLKCFPRLDNFEPRAPSGIRTVTTIEAVHESKIPAGVFEYQHAIGDDLKDALRQGFTDWMDCDLPVLLDLVNEELAASTAMVLKKAATESTPETVRRVLLGPPIRASVGPRRSPASPDPAAPASGHEFCPCCLLTSSLAAFQDLFNGDEFAGIRLYAVRGPEGVAQADCRINGKAFPAGKEALIKYVAKWPGTGIEFRKQYVVFEPRRNVPG